MATRDPKALEEKKIFEKNDVERLQDTLQKYVVRPLSFFGISGFIFDIDGDTTNTYTNEITDHYVEDNSALQDHIAKKPVKIVLDRFVGEKIYEAEPTDIRGKISKVASRLVPLVAALPALAGAANSVYNRGTNLDQANVGDVETVDNLYGLFQNLNPTASKQQRAYIYFKALAEQGVAMSIQTPFEYLSNMAIETITATQGSESGDIANFSVTMKQIRRASISLSTFDKDKFQGRAKNSKQPETDKGRTKGKNREPSILSKSFTKVTGG